MKRHELDMCCGTTCDRLRNQVYVAELEASHQRLQESLERALINWSLLGTTGEYKGCEAVLNDSYIMQARQGMGE
jgi:hypothetical protein